MLTYLLATAYYLLRCRLCIASLLPAPGISRVRPVLALIVALYGCPTCRRVIQHAGTPQMYRRRKLSRASRAPAKPQLTGPPTNAVAKILRLCNLYLEANPET